MSCNYYAIGIYDPSLSQMLYVSRESTDGILSLVFDPAEAYRSPTREGLSEWAELLSETVRDELFRFGPKFVPVSPFEGDHERPTSDRRSPGGHEAGAPGGVVWGNPGA